MMRLEDLLFRAGHIIVSLVGLIWGYSMYLVSCDPLSKLYGVALVVSSMLLAGFILGTIEIENKRS